MPVEAAFSSAPVFNTPPAPKATSTIQYANDFTWLAVRGYYIALTDDYTIALQALVSRRIKGKDTAHGEPDEDSAIRAFFLPTIDITWSTHLSATVASISH